MDANKQSLGGHKKAHNFRPSIWNGGWPFRSTESTVHGDHCEWIVAVLPDEPHWRQEKENEVLSARRNPAQLGSLKPRLVTQHTGWFRTERCESWGQLLDLQKFWGMLHLQKLSNTSAIELGVLRHQNTTRSCVQEKTTWPDVRPVIFWDQQEVQMASSGLPPGG